LALSRLSIAVAYVNIHCRTAIFSWLKDNEGRYFITVDTHIQRVANRTGYAKGKTVEETEQSIIKNTPNKSEFMFNLHHWLILHVRYTCVARKL
jgi:endonuclease-3